MGKKTKGDTALTFTKKKTSEIQFKGTIRPESRYMEIVRALAGAKLGDSLEVNVPKDVTPERMRAQIYQTLVRFPPEIAAGLRCKTGITTENKVGISIVVDRKRGRKANDRKARTTKIIKDVVKLSGKKAKPAKKKARKPSKPKATKPEIVEKASDTANHVPAAPTLD